VPAEGKVTLSYRVRVRYWGRAVSGCRRSSRRWSRQACRPTHRIKRGAQINVVQDLKALFQGLPGGRGSSGFI